MKMAVLLAGALAAGVWGLSAWAQSGKTGGCCGGLSALTATTEPATQPTTQATTYVCPMDKDVTRDKPGKCPKCGMDLVKK